MSASTRCSACASHVRTARLLKSVAPARPSLACRADADDRADSTSGIESDFAKELRRRQMNNTATADDSERPAGSRPPPDVQQPAEPSQTPQLDRSRLLNSEGLEGLIPRASLLLRTGGTFFLGFLPFILLASLLFVGMYFAFGEQFIHSGTTSTSLPGFVDPYDLLAEPTVDPYYPIN